MGISTSDYATVQEQLDRYVYSRDNGHTLYSAKARVCENFFAGEQWDPDAKAKLARQRRPALTFNKVLPSAAAIFGEQLNNQADISFKATKNGVQETADALQKVFIQIGNANNTHYIESEVFADGVITSRGFFDARMNFDTNIFGEVDVSLCNPRNVVIDPDAEEYDPDGWKDVFLSKWLSLNDIEMLYGKRASQELGAKTSSDRYIGYDFMDTRPDTFAGEGHRFPEDNSKYNRRWRQLERQHKQIQMKEHFVDMISGETRVIPDGMPREKIQLILQEFEVSIIKRKTECIKWTVTIDDVMVHNEESPYKHFTVVPFFPFFRRGRTIGVVPFFPFFRRGRTIGLVENLLDPQELYNKVRSQELHIVNTTANSGWKVKTGALQNMSIEDLEERGAETGLIAELNDMDGLDKITPNTVPTGMDRISYNSAEDLKEISMASDSIPSSRCLRWYSQYVIPVSAPCCTAPAGRAGSQPDQSSVHDGRTGKTEPRLIHITGNAPGEQDETMMINEVSPEGEIARDLTLGEYSLVVTSVPARETFEETQFEQAVQLRELGIAIPDEVLVENSHLARKGELAAKMAGGPSEEEAALQKQLAELELQAKQLENRKAMAEQKKIESEAALNLVRAQQTALADPDGQAGKANDDEIRLAEAEADREEAVAKIQLDKYKIDRELEIKRDEIAIKHDELRLKELEIRNKAVAEERNAKLKLVDNKTEDKTNEQTG